MKKKLAEYKDKTLLQAFKTIKNPFSMIAFIFFYKTKETLFLAIIVLIIIMKYPQIIDIINRVIK